MSTTRRIFRFSLLSLFFVGVLLTATSCLDDDNQNITPVEVAFVSLYHASPNAPDLDIVVDNRRINNRPFDYADYTGYLRFYTGSRNLRFGPYGASNVVVDTTLDLSNDKTYSIFLVDTYEKAEVLVTNDTSAVPAEGEAMVRFLNLSPDAPAVSLVADGETTPFFEGQSFKEASEFKAVEAGTFDLSVTPEGGGTPLLQMPDTQLTAGRYYTVIVRGYWQPPTGNTNVLASDILAE